MFRLLKENRIVIEEHYIITLGYVDPGVNRSGIPYCFIERKNFAVLEIRDPRTPVFNYYDFGIAEIRELPD